MGEIDITTPIQYFLLLIVLRGGSILFVCPGLGLRVRSGRGEGSFYNVLSCFLFQIIIVMCHGFCLAIFEDLHLTISKVIFAPNICYNWDDFNCDIVNFPLFWMVTFLDLPRLEYLRISRRIGLAKVSSRVNDFNDRNEVLNATHLTQGCQYHNLRKVFFFFFFFFFFFKLLN